MGQSKLEFIVSKGKSLLENYNEEQKLDFLKEVEIFLDSLKEGDPFFYAKGLIPKISSIKGDKKLRIFLIPFQRELARLSFVSDFDVSHLDSLKNKQKAPCDLYFVLENIRSAHNVGSIIRLAECLGVKEVIIAGYTPCANHPKVHKTSMGSEKLVHFKYFDEAMDAISYLKSKGVLICGLETVSSSENIFRASLNAHQSKALVVGNERHGISYDVLSSCDILLRIPVYGLKNSLNVSSSLSIAAYQLSHSSS